jgi:hypothetical protein
MSANRTRGTPGMILLGYALICSAVALDAAHLARRGAHPEARALSGLGDTDFYDGKLTENDFFNPALVFAEAPRGLHRRSVNPLHRDDAKMRPVSFDQTGRCIVYTDARPKAGQDGQPRARWYLKAGDNRYVEFGERKFFEVFPSGKAR